MEVLCLHKVTSDTKWQGWRGVEVQAPVAHHCLAGMNVPRLQLAFSDTTLVEVVGVLWQTGEGGNLDVPFGFRYGGRSGATVFSVWLE